VARVVVEQDQRHLRRPALAQLHVVRSGLFGDALAQTLAHALQVRDQRWFALGDVERG
jgi:hypothetical protein